MTEELRPLSPTHQTVLDKYFECWEQTEAYKHAYPRSSHSAAKTSAARLFADANFQAHLQARLAENHLSANEVLKRLADMARGDMGIFFKITDEWMFYPPPTSEILAEQEVIEQEEGKPAVKRISYRVRRVILDLDKVMNPRYSHLIKKFSDTNRGMSIEIHDAKDANKLLGEHHKLFNELGSKANPLHIDGLEKALDKIWSQPSRSTTE
jgi:succinate dehydrogenase flavin-adding protein (antitoxin of CptAB toxin-antitoxin module)